MVITVIMRHGQRAIVRAFEQGAVTSAATARKVAQIGPRHGLAWHQLVEGAVLRCPGEGRYFLDGANWQRLRRRLVLVTGVALPGGPVLLLATWLR